MHPTDPLYTDQWHLATLGDIETIWDEYSGAGIRVGVYDNGVQSNHPDLEGNYDASRHVDVGGGPVSGDPDLTDEDAHGTAVAGIIAAVANNGEGGVGIAWGSEITSVNILDPGGPLDINAADHTGFLAAIHQMVSFDLTNNSWNATVANYSPVYNVNGSSLYAETNGEFAYVSENGRGGLGTIIVQGIGNNNLDAQASGLNGSRFTITVAGCGPDGFAADYSNYGACVLVTGPTRPLAAAAGAVDGIVTTDLTGTNGYNLAPSGTGPDDYTDYFGGTSAAGPMVTGVVALMLEASSGLGWRDVQNILAASARHTGSDFGETSGANENGSWFLNHAAAWNGGSMHFSNDYGYGSVDVHDAVRMAEAWPLFTPTAQTTANEHWWGWDDSAVNRTIVDNGAIEYTFAFGQQFGEGDVEHVDLTLDLTHPDYRELSIFLISPGGTEVQLYDGSFGDPLEADIATSGLTWTYGADALHGESLLGQWTIRIKDAVDDDSVATLDAVHVKAYGQAASINDVYHYTDEFLDMRVLAGESARGTLADGNGGTDWIDAAALTGAMALNLAAGVTTKVNGASWFTIAAGTAIENAVTGDGNDTLIGNGAANKLFGMRGNDVLDGGTGADDLHGGKGNDTYVVDNPGDVIDEGGGLGSDLVKTSVSFSLAGTIHARGAIENLILLGTAKLNATGNALANTLTGNGGINVLNGAANNDVLNAGVGSDVLIGGLGRDTLIGAAGADRFDFNLIAESVKGANHDLISGFSHAQHDKIDLATIDADITHARNQAFVFIGHDSFAHYHAAHHAVVGMVRFAGGIVQANVNANLAADFEIKVTGSALAAGDFVL